MALRVEGELVCVLGGAHSCDRESAAGLHSLAVVCTALARSDKECVCRTSC